MQQEPKRVLIVSDGLDNGGAERQMSLLARNLPARYSVRVFALRDGPYADVLRDAGVDLVVDRRAWRYDVTPAIRLWGEMAAWRPDLVHSWGWMSSAAALPACRLRGIPLVDGTIRAGQMPDRWTRTNRFLVSRADAVIGNSAAGIADYGLSRRNVFVVHNGFEADRAPADTADREPWAGRRIEVVMAARMVPEKDYDTLLDAADLMRERGRDVGFTLMGPGPDRERLIARSGSLIEAGTVRFLDPGLEVMPVLASADIGVLLTDPRHHAEGLSNSIMEYMAGGLPVVCTDSGGNREVVVDGVTGLIIPPHDATALADALCRLMDEPETARSLGRAGRARIRDEFSTAAMVERTSAVYETVLRAP